jgi:hypothetical protein
MSTYHTENLLITTKTYPVPSNKYIETSCVAAINQNGEQRRLFPIPYRLMDGRFQFERWEWIKANIKKATNDNRPESYHIDIDSIQKLTKVDTSSNWSERLGWINPHLIIGFDSLETRRQKSGETLGFLRPRNFSLIVKKSDQPDWTEIEKAGLIRDGLFTSQEARNRKILEKIPFDFYYEYQCDECSTDQKHIHKITDWEIGQLYRNCINRYGPQWENYFRGKLQTEFSTKKSVIFQMGTVHRFPDQWLIIGLVYPPKVEARANRLFLEAPNGQFLTEDQLRRELPRLHNDDDSDDDSSQNTGGNNYLPGLDS